jgi:drug/metabolite transporter (DMT)-like permease
MANSSSVPSLAPLRVSMTGIAWQIAAGIGFVTMDSTAKFLSPDYPTIEITWARYFFHMLLALPILLAWRGGSVFRTRRLDLQLVRSLLLLGSTVFYYIGLRYIPIATAASIGFVAPMFLTALSVPLLKERVGMRRWIAVGIGFLAVLLIIRPGFGTMHWAMTMPVLVAACFAFYQIVTRLLGPIDHWSVTLFYSGVIGLLVMTAMLPGNWRWPDLEGWILMVFLGLVGILSHLCMIRAFTLAPASMLAPFSYLQLAWATASGYLLFGDLPDRWTVLGAMIIVLSGLYIWYRERVVAASP